MENGLIRRFPSKRQHLFLLRPQAKGLAAQVSTQGIMWRLSGEQDVYLVLPRVARLSNMVGWTRSVLLRKMRDTLNKNSQLNMKTVAMGGDGELAAVRMRGVATNMGCPRFRTFSTKMARIRFHKKIRGKAAVPGCSTIQEGRVQPRSSNEREIVPDITQHVAEPGINVKSYVDTIVEAGNLEEMVNVKILFQNISNVRTPQPKHVLRKKQKSKKVIELLCSSSRHKICLKFAMKII